MATRPALQAEKKSSSRPLPSSPENLLRSLIAQLSATVPDTSHLPEETRDCEEIVFDAVLEGEHYLLIRLPRATRPRIQLSPREQEIVRMVAQGHPNKIIADVLNISSYTVNTYLRRVFAKLGVGSRAAMVASILKNSNGREAAPPVAPATAAIGRKATA